MQVFNIQIRVDRNYVEIEGADQMPAILYDRMKETVREFYADIED